MGRGKGAGEENAGLATRRREPTQEQIEAIAAEVEQLEGPTVVVYTGVDHNGVVHLAANNLDDQQRAQLELDAALAGGKPVEVTDLVDFALDEVAIRDAFDRGGQALRDHDGIWARMQADEAGIRNRVASHEYELTQQVLRRGRGS